MAVLLAAAFAVDAALLRAGAARVLGAIAPAVPPLVHEGTALRTALAAGAAGARLVAVVFPTAAVV